MKAVESSMEEEECVIETVSSTKKKKMKQAQLPFQMLSTSKSSDAQHNTRTKTKRKLASPLVEDKKAKVMKLSTKENSARSDSEDKEEDLEEINLDDVISEPNVEAIKEERRKEKEQSTQQTHESKKEHITPKKSSLRKHKKLGKSQQKTGALTKFFKVSNKESESLDHSPCQTPDSDPVAVLSSDKEASSKVDKSTLSTSKKVNDESASVVTSISDKKKKKVKNLTPIQVDLSSENEASSELEKSTLSTSEKVINESTSAVTPTSDKKKKVKNLTSEVDLSSENETSSDLEESTLSTSEKVTNESTSDVTPTSNRKKKKVKLLTPKQLEKQQEIARKREEKLKLREERRKQQEAEKINRRRQKEERQREREERERMEKEEKKKEKQLKELRKQMEIEQKQKEREAKEEERKKREEAKVEEKRKKEEEKLEAERKKQKAASNFASFFVTKKQEVKSAEEEAAVETNFMPFEVKADMRVAPVNRRTITAEEKLYLDRNFNNTSVSHKLLYLENMKHGRHVPKTWPKTWPLETKDDEIVLLDEDNDGTSSNNIITDTHSLEKHRPKLLQFCENRRPPYWGTWRKRSNVITSTQPFVRDEKLFDYTVDSDDEWEEEEPGESLKGSDDEKDDENSEENEYDVDNEFMVPHGYLSDEEAGADAEEMEDMSPQIQKMKLKVLGEQFEAERNTKTQKLKPKLIGCVWQGSGNTFPESTPPKIKELLSARQAWVSNIPVTLPSAECKAQTPQQSVREKTKSKKAKLPCETLPDVLQLLHGNTHRKRLPAKKTKKNTETDVAKQ